MNLKRVDPEELGFSSFAFIGDEDIQDPKKGKIVALVLYNPGGDIIYLHKPEYYEKIRDGLEMLVAGEKVLFETMRAGRFKIYDVQVRSNREEPGMKEERILSEVICPERNVRANLIIEKESEDGMTVRCSECGRRITREIGYFSGFFDVHEEG